MVKVLFNYNSYLSNGPKTHHLRCAWILWDRPSGRKPGGWLFFAPRCLVSGASAGNSAAEGDSVARNWKHSEASLPTGGRCQRAASVGVVGEASSTAFARGLAASHSMAASGRLDFLQLRAPKASVPRKAGGKCRDFPARPLQSHSSFKEEA